MTDSLWGIVQQHAIQYFLTFLVVITHAALMASILGATAVIVKMILREEGLGRFLAWLAALSAALAYFLAKALGAPIPDIVLHSVSDSPFRLPLIIVAFLLPGTTGLLSAFLINKSAERDSEVFKRVMIFLTALLLLVFTDVYVAALRQAHGLDKQLAPNGAFVLGMSMYWILKQKTYVSN